MQPYNVTVKIREGWISDSESLYLRTVEGALPFK